MAELTFRSPGVGTREIDLSGPTAIKPQGTPAGIIGTALQGPAFVPQTVATWQDFVAIFGATDGEKLGPLAMYEWMKNSRAGTFLRVLGVGTGVKRSTAGTSDSDGNSIEAGGVKNAGFTVGQRLVKANGYVGDNPYTVENCQVKGRTYMLGAFMSASAGSSLFTDTGLQELESSANATATVLIDLASQIRTGVGAIICASAADTSGAGIVVQSAVSTVLDTKQFTIACTDQGFQTRAGTPATIENTHTIIMKNVDAGTWGGTPGTYEAWVNCTDGTASSTVSGVEVIAGRIIEVFKNDSAYSDADFSGTRTQLITYGSGWQLGSVSDAGTAGGDLDSVIEASAGDAGAASVKLQLRGYNAGSHAWGNDGPYGGARVTTGEWEVNVNDQLAGGTISNTATVTPGTAVGATTLTLTRADGSTTTTVTANGTAITDFLVNTSTTASTQNDNTATNLAGITVTGFTFAATDATVTATAATDSGERGNQSQVANDGAAGTFTVQGVVDGADEYFTGGAPGFIDAVPVVRGVLMFPSGVIGSLSGSGYTNNAPAAVAATTWTDTAGGWVGDINISNVQNYQFTLLLNGHADTEAYPNRITASLSPLSPSYLPNILNTDPMKIQQAGHYLYNCYTVHPNLAVITGSGVLAGGEYFIRSGSGDVEPVVFLLTSSLDRNAGSATKPNYEGFQDRFRTGFSPWVMSQKFGSDYKNLFKVHAIDDGENGSNHFRIQVENLKNGKLDNSFGQFDLLVKRIIPPDGVPPSEDSAIETYNGVNLDPSSDNYIARRIGDYSIYYDFDKMAGNQRVVVEGTHPNVSRFIRVQMHSDVTNRNIDKSSLPTGYRGPFHLLTSGSSIFTLDAACQATSYGGDARYIKSGSTTGRFNMINTPPNPQRQNISIGTDPSREVNSKLPWGFQFESLDSATEPNRNSNVDERVMAFTKYYPHFQTLNKAAWQGDNAGALDSAGSVYDSDRFNQNVFTMERIQIHTKSTSDVVDSKEWAFAAYRRNGKLSGSLRKEDGTYDQGRFLNVSKDFDDPAATKFLKFTFPMQGGFDGVNIFDKEKSKLSNLAAVREMDDENQGQADGPTVRTYMKALDVMAEKSDVDVQILAVPGIRETKVTDHALTKTEERFDAIYIMDIEERDAMNNAVTASNLQNVSVGNTVDNFKSRVLDSSFGAAYFPDVLVTDPTTLTNVRCAPSVAVIGAFAHNDKVAYPWYAPAGFTRGALKRVVQATVNLSRGNLDSLYDADINPITKFPTSEGVVVFGQKTLLAVASSLDRVNVRRLLIDIRRKVRRIADTFLFEPNREDTLARFSAAVNPVLTRIQQQQGLDRFKVIIDTTTTTQADVENNTIRGKIFLQPTRSIEFISLDFVVTNNGTEI